MSNSKHILLISYVFPPYYGIGGRRWAKHSDELTKLGYTVHVICAKNPFDENSLWTNLIEKNPNIIVYPLPTMFPKVMVKFNHNFFQKIAYKFWFIILPLFTKGSYLDRTIFWKRKMLNKAKEVISENNIKHVICSGGPFGAMYYTTLLRKWFHDIFILNDFRDPWTWGPNWGFQNLEPKRMVYERYLEFKTIENSDLVSVPSADMRDYLITKYPNQKHKIIQIHHFFDTDELCVLPKIKSNNLRLIMYGNIYHNIDDYIKKLAQVMAKHVDEIILDIYTDKIQHKDLFEKFGAKNVNFYDQIPAKDLFEKFCNYDFVILFNPQYNINNISTKFYEIIYTKTPIILFCEDGKGPKYITENNLGLHADINEIDNLFNKLISNTLNFKYNINFNIDEYSLKNVVKDLSILLDKSASYDKQEYINGKLSKNVLITFDYELFFGKKSGTVENCILKPTQLILDLLKKQDIKKALFFIDTIYIKRLKEINNIESNKDLQNIKHQLCDILKNGHYIFPHIHPHWIDVIYIKEINQWNLSNISNYRFNSIPFNVQSELFEFSISFIKSIQETASIYYPINGYRAGGWCIQPFSDFQPFFIKYGLTNDFSVLKHFKNLNPKIYYNFSNVPRKNIYQFDDLIEVELENGPNKEYSISWIEFDKNDQFINRLFLKYLKFRGITNLGDGLSVEKTEEQIIKDIDIDMFEINGSKIEMISMDLLKIFKLKGYKKMLKNNGYLHFISHPKMISSHNIKSFDKFITYAKKYYFLQTDYEKMN